MRQLTALLLLPWLYACSSGTPPPEELTLVGTWVGKDPVGMDLTVTFHEDGRLRMEWTGGDMKRVGNGRYTTDTSQTPHHLDVELENGSLATIYEFEDARTVHIEGILSPDEGRPPEFTAERKLTYKRKK